MKAIFRIIVYIFFCIFFLHFFSCKNNIKNITITGTILNENDLPIANSEVVILCWNDLGILRDEFDYSKAIINTDSFGKFFIHFKEGFKVDIAARSLGYEISTMTLNKLERNNFVKIILDKNINSAICYDNKELTLSYRKYNDSLVGSGINVSLGINVENIKNADVWIENEDYLITPIGGGIIPILGKKDEINLLHDYTMAPLEGYNQKYKITGEELGYFIKTKEGMYAKLILTYPFEKDSKNSVLFQEKGFLIKIIYQSNKTNILSINQNIDLEKILLSTY